MNDLTEAEKEYLRKYKKNKRRGDRKITDFIYLIKSLREQPEKNPQIKADKQGKR